MTRDNSTDQIPNAATVPVTIDGVPVAATPGQTLLDLAEAAHIAIPTLCHHPDLPEAGNCRLCVVEIEGERALHPACAYRVTGPLSVRTRSPRLRRIRRDIIDLLLSEHAGDCATCSRNGHCELQTLAAEHGLDHSRFGRPTTSRWPIDQSSPAIIRDMDKCVLCGRCVRACGDLQDIGILSVINRGDDSKIGAFMDLPLAHDLCIHCGQCLTHCPTGALSVRDFTDDVWAEIDDPNKHVIIQTAPAPRAAIGECFGLAPGRALTGELNTALRQIGFSRVFDTNFTADLTVVEEGTELLLRLKGALTGAPDAKPLPQLSSCCPGWVTFIEQTYPQRLAHMSSAKSPQQMFGALMKTAYADWNGLERESIVSVSLMPCTAKKFERNRPEMQDSGDRDIDFVLSTVEAAKMIRQAGLALPDLPPSGFDDPFGGGSGSGVIFGATGGVMESALRTVLELVTGQPAEAFFENADITPIRGFEGVRSLNLTVDTVGPVPDLLQPLFDDFDWLKGATLKLAVCNGIANARKVMDDIEAGGPFADYHFIEVMTCPGGCLGGGGQPVPVDDTVRAARAQAIYAQDSRAQVRKAHANPVVQDLYRRFLTDGPCGPLSHRLLHTRYQRRGKYIS